MAILRHVLPDGSAHHDLLLAGGEVPDQAREVPTWRCPADPMALPPGKAMTVERLAPHRGLYLRLRTVRVLDGGRGCVEPVHAGWHFRKDGLLWMATKEHAALPFVLQDDTLRRVQSSVS